jgi:acetoin:2,6-dichlorophenolindophenol oxidoreductase subunit alpha
VGNTRREADHAHSTWRDRTTDFALDAGDAPAHGTTDAPAADELTCLCRRRRARRRKCRAWDVARGDCCVNSGPAGRSPTHRPSRIVRRIRRSWGGIVSQQSHTGVAVTRYEQMVFIRRFLERLDTLYRQGQIHGPVHLGLGQEAIAVGVGGVLRTDDYSIGTYRGHAHALARGAPAEAILAELVGREGGICANKGGSMHITSVEHHYYGSYAIVGAHLPIAVGLAWASRIKNTDQVTVCFFGDGTVNIGAFHEAVNLAAVWRLPVVFVCENNQYMEYTPISSVIPTERPAADKAAAYGLARIVVDGNDVDAVASVVGAAVEAARRGDGPALVEADTYRLRGHSAADAGAYRPAAEVQQWAGREPILRQREALLEQGVDGQVIDGIDTRIQAEVTGLAERVLAGPRPAGATAWGDVWSDGGWQWRN